MFQRRRGISTGLASSASSSRKAKQTRTVREAKHRWLHNPRRNQMKRCRTDGVVWYRGTGIIWQTTPTQWY